MLGNALQYLVGIAAAVAVLVHDMVARVGVKAYAQGAPGRVIAANSILVSSRQQTVRRRVGRFSFLLYMAGALRFPVQRQRRRT